MRSLFRKKLLFVTFAVAAILLCTPDDNPQSYRLPDLSLATRSDSTVAARESLYIYITTDNEAGMPLSYCLARDDSWSVDTVSAPGFSIAWDLPDTGMHRCIVWAFDSSGRQSNTDTISVRVYCRYPVVSLRNDTSVFVNHKLLLRCDTDGTGGTVTRHVWFIDGVVQLLTNGDTDSLLWSWGPADTGCHTVSVVAVDKDGLVSDTATQEVCVAATLPELQLSGDTAVSVNDTARFICSPGTGTTTIRDYQWSTDPEGAAWLTTPTDTLTQVWRLPDTGLRIIRCRIIDTHGTMSPPESLTVHVSAVPPAVSISGPGLVHVDNASVFTAVATDEDGTVARLLWQSSAPESTFTTAPDDSTITLTWSIADTGECYLRVTAVDDDSLRSTEAVCTVQVISGYPVLLPVNDTTLPATDTLIISRIRADSNNTVIRYYFDTDNAEGWDDSSTAPVCTLTYSGVTPVRLATGVLSDKGILFTDTITVRFNRPPVFDTLSLVDDDTVWCTDDALPGTIPLTVTATDPDNDPLQTSILWGRQPPFDTITWSDTCKLTVDSTGWYEWTVITRDTMNQTATRSGTTCIGREYTVCFAGHSIVAGFINDGTTPSTQGGFRAGVLANLRDSLAEYERIRPVGPFVTTEMSATPEDDSCYAVSGSVAREMYLLLEQAYPDLTADIWVVMFGVNGSFSDIEMKATAAIIRSAYTRNPAARLYALTSPPFSGASWANYVYYNGNLRDTVAFWQTAGFDAFTVEVDSLLSDGYNIYDSLYSDNVHPNQAGYDAIRDEILEVMWSSEPPPFTVRREE